MRNFKSYIAITVLLLGFACQSQAQQRTLRASNRLDRIIFEPSIGIKGGITGYNYLYTDYWYDDIEQNKMDGTMFGVVAEFPYNRWLSPSIELMKITRGTDFSYVDRMDDTVNYSVQANYLDLRLPVFLKANATNWFQPFIFGGLDFGYNYGGTIHIKQSKYGAGFNNGVDNPNVSGDPVNGYDVLMGKANMAQFTSSAFAGAGLRFNIFFPRWALIIKVSGAYNFGFVNTFSKMEMAREIDAINVNSYILHGRRFNKGYELCGSIAVPLRYIDKSCSGWRNKRDQRLFSINRRK